MPRLSEFYGIRIFMYYNDHPPPHFHAQYGDLEGVIAIDSMIMLRGSLPGRALRMVEEWGKLHRQELTENWHLARMGQPIFPIEPIE